MCVWLLFFLIGISNSLLGRTWTSAKGKGTFEGTLRNYNPETGEVSMVSNGSLIKCGKSMLSDADITFLEKDLQLSKKKTEQAKPVTPFFTLKDAKGDWRTGKADSKFDLRNLSISKVNEDTIRIEL